jgi:hypothetical protein
VRERGESQADNLKVARARRAATRRLDQGIDPASDPAPAQASAVRLTRPFFDHAFDQVFDHAFDQAFDHAFDQAFL